MAAPNSKATLKEYALRQLGKPVIEINVLLMLLLNRGDVVPGF